MRKVRPAREPSGPQVPGRVQPSRLSPCTSPHAAARPVGGRIPDPTLPGQREVSLQPMPGVFSMRRSLRAETHLSEKAGSAGRHRLCGRFRNAVEREGRAEGGER